MKRVLYAAVVFVLMGCASTPPVPPWQKNATQAVDQATRLALQGQDRLAEHHWAVAVAQVRRTTLPAPMVRVELIRCAVAQASTLQRGCPGFEALRSVAPESDLSYARYLMGKPNAADVSLLPAAHQSVAKALLGAAEPAQLENLLRNIADPLSQLVAASVVVQHSPSLPVVAAAVDTASAQGWQRALLTWLTLQQRLAQEQGQDSLAAQAQQRLQWLSEAAVKPPRPN